MHVRRSTLTCGAVLLWAVAAAAQETSKPAARPLPIVDLDNKPWQQATAVVTPAKAGARDAVVERAEPAKGAEIRLPNGAQVQSLWSRDPIAFVTADGADWAATASYKAVWRADGMTFTPALGSNAPQSHPFTVALGATAGPLAARAVPQRRGNDVVYDRGAVREVYRVTADHVEQLFEVDSWPSDDLVLPIRVDTRLEPTLTPTGIEFRSPYGGVHYGLAVLIDANGARHAMRTELADGGIRLSARVAGLRFPVVVDPIIRSFVAYSSSFVLIRPDVAFGQRQRQHLVVLERVISASDSDVYSVMIDAQGVPVAGTAMWIDISTDAWRTPRVAYNYLADRFLVVASRTPASGGSGTTAIWSRTRDAAAAVLGTPTQLSSTEFGDKVLPDVGGDFYDAGPTYFAVVWQRNFSVSDTDIHYRRVQSDGTPLGVVQNVDNSSAVDSAPRIAKSDGAGPSNAQAWPVVWHRQIGSQFDIYGARLSWDGVLATPPFGIDTTLDDDRYPAVSSLTDEGRQWLVAYQTAARGDLDIYTRCYQDAAAPTQLAFRFLADAEGLDAATRARNQSLPAVDSDGCRFAVAYIEEFSATDNDVWVTPVHRWDAAIHATEARLPVDRTTDFSATTSIGSEHSGGGPVGRYAAVWNAQGTVNEVRGTVLLGAAPGGYAVRATACAGLTLSHNGTEPTLGANLAFTIGGTSSARLHFVSVPATPVTICPEGCKLGINTLLMVTLPGTTLTLRVPCGPWLIGSTVSFQGGAIPVLGGCASFGGLALTDTIDVTIR